MFPFDDVEMVCILLNVSCHEAFIHELIDGFAQNCSISIANAQEMLQSCTKPLMCAFVWHSPIEVQNICTILNRGDVSTEP